MKHQIDDSLQNDVLRLILDADETLKARPKAVVSKTSSISLQASADGEGHSSTIRALASGKQFPVTSLEASETKGSVTLAPPLPGTVIEAIPRGEEFVAESLGFLATDSAYTLDTKADTVYTNDALTTIRFSGGDGPIFLGSVGGASTIELDDGEQTRVYEDYLLGFDGTVDYKKEKSSGVKDRFLGADQKPEVKLIGPGRVYLHARSPFTLADTVNKLAEFE